MPRSITRSRPPPIPCLRLRADPATFSSPISTGTVRGHTGSGSIRADKLGAGSKLDTGSGTIEATNLMGSATLETGSGDLRASLTSAGDVVASTGSGSINLTNVQGAVKAETGSGTLEISGQPTSPWKLETGSGDISMRLGSSAHFTLDAETGSGTVKSDLPLTVRGAMDKHHIIGTVNGGGPTIKAANGLRRHPYSDSWALRHSTHRGRRQGIPGP